MLHQEKVESSDDSSTEGMLHWSRHDGTITIIVLKAFKLIVTLTSYLFIIVSFVSFYLMLISFWNSEMVFNNRFVRHNRFHDSNSIILQVTRINPEEAIHKLPRLGEIYKI